MAEKGNAKQNLTIQLDRPTIQKAKILAARESTSIGELVARLIATIVDKDEQYQRAKRHALGLLEQGFHLGGKVRTTRDELHQRHG